MHRPVLLLSLALLTACGAPRTAWDGRRGYDGRGDYGYDLNASRAAPRSARPGAQPAASYPAPGPPGDPWGPYIREAAARHGVPELWIREVMRQESGGRAEATSPVGAMGLMQLMPTTWDRIAPQLGLGADPYEPRGNISAGTAYIRDMHQRYGAPGFLAAYNAGPDRVDLFLAGATILPDETMDYIARIAPRIGIGPDRAGAFAEAVAWRGGDAALGSGAMVTASAAGAALPR
jgi:hypothetical protein